MAQHWVKFISQQWGTFISEHWRKLYCVTLEKLYLTPMLKLYGIAGDTLSQTRGGGINLTELWKFYLPKQSETLYHTTVKLDLKLLGIFFSHQLGNFSLTPL